MLLGEGLAGGAQVSRELLIAGGGPVLFEFVPRVEFQPPPALAPEVVITAPATLTTVGATPVQVTGTVSDPGAQLTLNGAPVATAGGGFQAPVALQEGLNTIVARAVDAQGREGTDSIVVSMDRTPPYVTIEAPRDGAVVNQAQSDIVRGTVSADEAKVSVNGGAHRPGLGSDPDGRDPHGAGPSP